MVSLRVKQWEEINNNYINDEGGDYVALQLDNWVYDSSAWLPQQW